MQRDDLQNQLFDQSSAFQRAWRLYFGKQPDVISMPQCGLMLCIKSKQPVSGKAIAEYIGVSRSAVTQLLDALSSEGFIERHPDAHDRRITYISLTQKGTQRLEEIEQVGREFFSRVTQVLTDEEMRTIIRIQTKMLQQIDADLVE